MTECLLEGCHKKARIKFCSDKHKDRYHNLKNPRGFYAHLYPNNKKDKDPLEHPFSSEALGQD